MPSSFSRAAVLAGAALAAAATLAACGGDSGYNSPATTTSSTPATAEGQSVNVSETEYKLTPSTVTVEPGIVDVKVTNDGAITHTLEVEGPSGDEELTKDLAAGESGTLTVDFTEPGTYKMYCPIGTHEEQGMVGEVVVK